MMELSQKYFDIRLGRNTFSFYSRYSLTKEAKLDEKTLKICQSLFYHASFRSIKRFEKILIKKKNHINSLELKKNSIEKLITLKM